MGKLSKWIAVDENDEYEDQNVLEIYDVLDQNLNATEENRDALAKKHPFMAPFVTGTLKFFNSFWRKWPLEVSLGGQHDSVVIV